MIIPCILVLSFELDFVWSTRYFPVYPVSQPCLCPALSCLDVYIKDYLSLRPRLRVPVPPSCVHRDSVHVCISSGCLKVKNKHYIISKVC